MRSLLTRKLGDAMREYKRQLVFARENEKYVLKFINHHSRTYYEEPSVGVWKKMNLKLNDEYDIFMNSRTWIRTVCKMNPVEYHAEHTIYCSNYFSKSWVMYYHENQLTFAGKILPLMWDVDLSNEKHTERLIHNYAGFLHLCNSSKKTIVPTLLEDFVWHSHMMLHTEYVEDTTKIFGRVLDHRIKMTKEELEEKKKESEQVRSENGKNENMIVGGCCSDITDPCNPLSPLSPLHPMSPFHHGNRLNDSYHSGCMTYYKGSSFSSCFSDCSSCSSDSSSSCGGD